MNIIKKQFNFEIDNNSELLMRFMTHLRFLAYRIYEAKNGKYAKEAENVFLSNVLKVAVEEKECVEKITQLISRKYDYKLSKNEKCYLIIHICSIRNKAHDIIEESKD